MIASHQSVGSTLLQHRRMLLRRRDMPTKGPLPQRLMQCLRDSCNDRKQKSSARTIGYIPWTAIACQVAVVPQAINRTDLPTTATQQRHNAAMMMGVCARRISRAELRDNHHWQLQAHYVALLEAHTWLRIYYDAHNHWDTDSGVQGQEKTFRGHLRTFDCNECCGDACEWRDDCSFTFQSANISLSNYCLKRTNYGPGNRGKST